MVFVSNTTTIIYGNNDSNVDLINYKFCELFQFQKVTFCYALSASLTYKYNFNPFIHVITFY